MEGQCSLSLKKGYGTLYDQCLQEVKDKLKATDNWASIQRDQLLHKLINKIEKICLGFDNYKQEVFNLMQALKTLFLYLQSDKKTLSNMDKTSARSGKRWRHLEVPQGYTKA